MTFVVLLMGILQMLGMGFIDLQFFPMLWGGKVIPTLQSLIKFTMLGLALIFNQHLMVGY